MDSNIKPNTSLEEQLKLAKVLLHHYDTFHPFLEHQLVQYTVACCNIGLPGTVKFDVGSKTITFDIKTEKKYKFEKGKLSPIKKSKVTTAQYKKQKKIAKLNLEDWTKKLLWGEGTTVRIYIDGTEYQ
jgi:hypothetical protein